MALAAAKIEKERVQKSVAHLNPSIDAQLFIKGVPHLTEHSIEKGYLANGQKKPAKMERSDRLVFLRIGNLPAVKNN